MTWHAGHLGLVEVNKHTLILSANFVVRLWCPVTLSQDSLEESMGGKNKVDHNCVCVVESSTIVDWGG